MSADETSGSRAGGSLSERAQFFVYYRVAEPAKALLAVGDLLADVEARTGVAGRLVARCDDPSTWMEIYEPVADADAFARDLAACVRNTGAADVAANGVRTVERFRALRLERDGGV